MAVTDMVGDKYGISQNEFSDRLLRPEGAQYYSADGRIYSKMKRRPGIQVYLLMPSW
jgi:hypothetical protein